MMYILEELGSSLGLRHSLTGQSKNRDLSKICQEWRYGFLFVVSPCLTLARYVHTYCSRMQTWCEPVAENSWDSRGKMNVGVKVEAKLFHLSD